MYYQSFIIIILSIGLVACSNRPISSNELNVVKTIADDNAVNATILSVREVKTKSKKQGIASSIGKTLGSYGGGAMGAGVLSAAGSMAGGVVGGVIGSGIDDFNATESAIELLLKTDDGKTLLLTQLEGETFKVGDKVSLITLGSKTHVVKRGNISLAKPLQAKPKPLKKLNKIKKPSAEKLHKVKLNMPIFL